MTLTVVTGLDYVLQAWRLVRTSPRTIARRAARTMPTAPTAPTVPEDDVPDRP